MYKVDKNFTWGKYFKQVDIYQGRSHWTTVCDLTVMWLCLDVELSRGLE